jgi:hypothetical protein
VGGRCQVAKATYRDILERRARENAVDFAEGVATALTPIAFFGTFMMKSYETHVDSDTRFDVDTGIVAASRLQAVIGPGTTASISPRLESRWAGSVRRYVLLSRNRCGGDHRKAGGAGAAARDS